MEGVECCNVVFTVKNSTFKTINFSRTGVFIVLHKVLQSTEKKTQNKGEKHHLKN